MQRRLFDIAIFAMITTEDPAPLSQLSTRYLFLESEYGGSDRAFPKGAAMSRPSLLPNTSQFTQARLQGIRNTRLQSYYISRVPNPTFEIKPSSRCGLPILEVPKRMNKCSVRTRRAFIDCKPCTLLLSKSYALLVA